MRRLILATFLLAGCIRAPIYPGSRMTAAQVSALATKGFALEHLEVAPGISLVGLERAPAKREAKWILFFSGNGSSLESSEKILRKVAPGDDVGLAVFAYRGYDSSDGTPRERDLVLDAEVIRAHLEEKHGVKPEQVALFGYSLGTGVASRLDASLAKRGTPARALVLVAPFTSIRRIANKAIPCGGFCLGDTWRTDSVAADLTAPILIVHGAADQVVPVQHGRDLAKSLGERATFVELPDRDHTTVWGDPKTFEQIRQFLAAH